MTSIGSVALSESEAHHASHVLRLIVGDAVELFNGEGLVGNAALVAIRKQEVTCQVTQLSQELKPDQRLTLATAVPKGERFDWLVEKATELGVDRLVPLITARSTVDPRDSKLERLRQLIVAACKQSRRTWLMELTAPMTWTKFLASSFDGTLLVAHPAAGNVALCDLAAPPHVTLAIGPEGGFTEDEIQSAEARGARQVHLGPNILRIETAALAAAAWKRFRRPIPQELDR